MDTAEKVRENRIRRMLKRQGYCLMKSRRRDTQAIDFGGYMIVDASSNGVAYGSNGWAFSATLDEVEEWANIPVEED